MEVVAVTVKKILIIARNAGSGELTYYNRIDSEFSEMAMARDADAIAEGILQSGYTPVVYAPRATYDKNYYAHYARFIKKATVLYTAGDLATELPEISAAVLSGVPAKAGTSNAFMDETFAPRFRDYYIDGKTVGEIGIYKTFLAMNGIKIIGFMGDKAACEEANAELGNVFTVVTKTATSRFCANAKLTADEIRQKATSETKTALADFTAEKFVKPAAANVGIEFMREDDLEDFLFVNDGCGFIRTGARRVAKTVKNTRNLPDFTGTC